jgi:arylformamidase
MSTVAVFSRPAWRPLLPWALFLAIAVGGTRPAGAALPEPIEVSYGPAEAQALDVYRPAGARGAPVIVMVHGGAWQFGDKASRGVVDAKASRWVARGLVFVSVNYRMLPDARPLEQADDVARAVALVQRRAAEWGGDGSAVILMGHSAGAHLVALLTADRARGQRAGLAPWLGTVALDSAAYDLTRVMARKHYRFYDRAFGADPAYWHAASPSLLVSAPMAPMAPLLAVCSSEREDGACEQARDFVARLNAAGGRGELLPQARSHREINVELGEDSDYTRQVEAFMASLSPTVRARLGR